MSNPLLKTSPSSAASWVHCTAGPQFIVDNLHRLPEKTDTAYSLEGKEAHDWAKKLNAGEITAEQIPEKFREPVVFYCNVCTETYKLHPQKPDRYLEEEVPPFYRPEGKCFIDFGLISSAGIDINDYKHGAGVPVDAVNNEQLAIYAQSLITSLDGIYAFPDDLPVRIRIIQPRYNGEEKVKLWELTVVELREFCEKIDESANIVLNYPQHQKFAPSEGDHGACRWCRAKAICQARHDAMQAGLLSEFEVIEDVIVPTPSTIGDSLCLSAAGVLTEDQVVRLFTNRDAIRSLLGHVEDYCLEMANAGRPLPGTKLVQGKKRNRAWTDKDRAVELLKRKFKQDDYLDRTLMSPAKIVDELLKTADVPQKYKDSIAALVTRADGPLVITTADDKRPEVKPAISEFSVINDEPETADE